MAKALNRFNADAIKRRAKKPGMHHDGGGLYLRVSPAGAVSWAFRYMLNHKAREMGLGPYPEISLTAARELAKSARAQKALGEDPIDAREAVRSAARTQAARSTTFRQCAEAYIEAHRDSWKNAKHRDQWGATLETYAMPVIGEVAVSEIDRALVIKVLEPIWKTKTETARRLRGRIESVLDWATARDLRTGDNPARWKGSLQQLFPSRSKARQVRHHPALPYREIASFMSDLVARDGVAAAALRFTILTAARTGEAIGASWDEFDLEKAIWAVPAARTKTGREHRVPLSGAAVALLRARHAETEGEGFVFPGMRPHKPLSNMAMLTTHKRIGRPDLTVHGFRSTFRDWTEEETQFAGSVAEAALGHVVGDKVEAAYRRGDLFEKRRELMDAWGAYCCPGA